MKVVDFLIDFSRHHRIARFHLSYFDKLHLSAL